RFLLSDVAKPPQAAVMSYTSELKAFAHKVIRNRYAGVITVTGAIVICIVTYGMISVTLKSGFGAENAVSYYKLICLQLVSLISASCYGAWVSARKAVIRIDRSIDALRSLQKLIHQQDPTDRLHSQTTFQRIDSLLSIQRADQHAGLTKLNQLVIQLITAHEYATKAFLSLQQNTKDIATQSESAAMSALITSQNVVSIAQTTERLSSSSITGSESIKQMSGTISEIAQNCRDSVATIDQAKQIAYQTQQSFKQLKQLSEQIGEMADLIDEIADNTHLLGLNATIEAASAGEAGRSFTVVANEVKALAIQSAQTVEQINTQIEKVQHSISEAVKQVSIICTFIEDINTRSNHITAAIDKQTNAMDGIAQTSDITAQSAKAIASTVNDSGSVLANISENIAQVSLAASKTSEDSEQLKMHINQLSSITHELRNGLELMIEQVKS
ncbi:MAG: hypothetical protein JW795_21000, partial [Chitinivibrionales bacterium]|nr:hypothetical protein [Chitinivibrionales bacterium]